jgi:hypothetical protein
VPPVGNKITVTIYHKSILDDEEPARNISERHTKALTCSTGKRK